MYPVFCKRGAFLMHMNSARSRVRAVTAIAVSVVLGAALAVTAVSPASASSFVLCKGYTACQSYGMSTHGYSSASKNSYWRMFAGHNCTNYTAFMMIKAGMSSTRPWVGNGGANGWGVGNKSKKNSTPAAGSIAWWSSGNGHVAYVEAVLSPTQILISEDNWGGDFYWKILTQDVGGWPSGFIHFKDSTTGGTVPELRGREYSQTVYTDSSRAHLANTAIMKPGSTAWVDLRVLNTGTAPWSGLHLQTSGAATSAIDGGWESPANIATQAEEVTAPGQAATFSFPIQIPDGLGDATPVAQKFVAVTEDATAVPYSTFHFAVTADSRSVFTQTPTPAIGGVTAQGSSLSAVSGTWKPGGGTLSYQWSRNGKAIEGATDANYELKDADVGRTLTVSITGTATGFITASARSNPTPVISSIYSNSLLVTETLAKGKQIVSMNGKYRAYQSAGGALVLQDRFTGKVKWSNKAKSKSGYTTLSETGTLSTYNSVGKRLWTSGKKTGAVRLCVTSSGKLQIRNADEKVLWSAG
jgi:surface antigen